MVTGADYGIVLILYFPLGRKVPIRRSKRLAITLAFGKQLCVLYTSKCIRISVPCTYSDIQLNELKWISARTHTHTHKHLFDCRCDARLRWWRLIACSAALCAHANAFNRACLVFTLIWIASSHFIPWYIFNFLTFIFLSFLFRCACAKSMRVPEVW